MAEQRDDFAGKPHEEVAALLARSGPDSENDRAARAEFVLRQTRFLERQAKAAEASADANLASANATQRYTRYILWAVIVLAASSVVGLVTLVVQGLGE